MRCVSIAWPYRALIQSTIVSTAKPTRQKSSRGVNCGYTDFTSSLLVRFTPTIYPCSDQPLIQAGFWSAHRGRRCTRGNIDSNCPLEIACVLLRKIEWSGFIIIDWRYALSSKIIY